MKTCTIPDCDRKLVARGMCAFHYKRAYFGRDLTAPKRPSILLPKNHPVYVAWVNMKTRCDNPLSTQYRWYGGRGITYCERWQWFDNFYDDMFDSWREGLTLDRKRNNEDYSPDNCTWATKTEQARNRNPRGYLENA
jgi:hypothetical protein